MKLPAKAQASIEYMTILALVVAGIVLMGPYVIRAINAHFHALDDQIQDSYQEDFIQTPRSTFDLPDCSCGGFQPDALCGGGECDATTRRYSRTCVPLGCEDFFDVGITEECRPEINCCTGWEDSGVCGAFGTDQAGNPCPPDQMMQTRACQVGCVNPLGCETTPEGCPCDTKKCVLHGACTIACGGSAAANTELCPGDNLNIPPPPPVINFSTPVLDCDAPPADTEKCNLICLPGYRYLSAINMCSCELGIVVKIEFLQTPTSTNTDQSREGCALAYVDLTNTPKLLVMDNRDPDNCDNGTGAAAQAACATIPGCTCGPPCTVDTGTDHKMTVKLTYDNGNFGLFTTANANGGGAGEKETIALNKNFVLIQDANVTLPIIERPTVFIHHSVTPLQFGFRWDDGGSGANSGTVEFTTTTTPTYAPWPPCNCPNFGSTLAYGAPRGSQTRCDPLSESDPESMITQVRNDHVGDERGLTGISCQRLFDSQLGATEQVICRDQDAIPCDELGRGDTGTMQCPPGYVATGVYGGAGKDGFVRSIMCRQLVNMEMSTTTIHSLVTPWIRYGVCPLGSVLTGISYDHRQADGQLDAYESAIHCTKIVCTCKYTVPIAGRGDAFCEENDMPVNLPTPAPATGWPLAPNGWHTESASGYTMTCMRRYSGDVTAVDLTNIPDCISWPALDTYNVPYSNFTGPVPPADTCDGDAENIYSCPKGLSATCTDVATYLVLGCPARNGCPGSVPASLTSETYFGSRDVTCVP